MSAQVDELIGEYDYELSEEEEEVLPSKPQKRVFRKARSRKRVFVVSEQASEPLDKGENAKKAKEDSPVVLLNGATFCKLIRVRGARDKAADQAAQFMVFERKLYEVQRFSKWPCSWFVDDTVMSDGGIYWCTEFDPLLTLIPFLAERRKGKGENGGMFMELDMLLADPPLPGYSVFDEYKFFERYPIECICETRKSDGGTVFYRLSDELTSKYISAKAMRLAEHLFEYDEKHGELPENVAPPRTNANLFKKAASPSRSKKSAKSKARKSVADYVPYALSMLSDYVQLQWFKGACNVMGISDVDSVLPRVRKPTTISGFFGAMADKKKEEERVAVSDLPAAEKRRRLEAFMKQEEELKKKKENAAKAQKSSKPQKLVRGQKTMGAFFMPAKKKSKQ